MITKAITSPGKAIERNKNDALEEKAIEHDRYEVGERIGEGTWGQVYAIKDRITGEDLAGKVLAPTILAEQQMLERNLDPAQIMLNEGSFTAASRVVPRRIEVDKNGKYFIIMPRYPRSLEQALSGLRHRDRKITFNYLKDIAEGLSEFHTKFGKAHSDLKPDNILIDKQNRASINDLGTATCASVGRSIFPRDNMGFMFTRAPECFREGGHPDYHTDCYSFSSLATKMLTGSWLLEDELRNAKDPALFFEQLGADGINRLIKKQLKHPNIPRKLRKFLRKCANFNPHKRPYNGKVLQKELNNVLQNLSFWDTFKNSLRWSLPLAGSVAAMALSAYGVAVHEPTKLDMPTPLISGNLYLQPKPDEEVIEFDHEGNPKERIVTGGMLIQGGERNAKLSTDNRVVAYLLKCYSQANRVGGLGGGVTDYQSQIYVAYTIPEERRFPKVSQYWAVVSKTIEVALTQSKTKGGKVDLEDMCALTRLGPSKVMEAKRISRSEDWRDYQSATYSDGKPVIPKGERRFLNTWLTYIHTDI